MHLVLRSNSHPGFHHDSYDRSGEPGLVDRVFASHAGVEGSTPTGGTCPNDFSD